MSATVMMYKNDLYLNKEYLKKNGVSDKYIRVAQSRSSQGGSSWEHVKNGGETYIKYTSIPSSTLQKLPDPVEIYSLRRDLLAGQEIVSNALYTTFKLFLKEMTLEEAKAAAIIHEAGKYIFTSGISFHKSGFFKELSHEIKLAGVKYLPAEWRNLRNKIEAYSKQLETIDRLVYAKNRGNQNRSIIKGNEQVLSWLLDLGRSKKNFTYAQIYRQLYNVCTQHAVNKIPSQRWVGDWLNRPETQMLISERFGANSRFNP